MALKRVRQQYYIGQKPTFILYTYTRNRIAMQVPKSEANKLIIDKEGMKLVFADNYQSVG